MEVRGAKSISANFKFNNTLRDSLGVNRYVLDLHTGLRRIGTGAPAVKLFPHQLVLRQVAQQIEQLNIYQPVPLQMGAQDIHWSEDGSFTNAPFSAVDLTERKVHNVLIGHSETRIYFGVKDDHVARKLDAALKAGLFATVCVGEEIEDKQAGRTADVIGRQVEKGILAALQKNKEAMDGDPNAPLLEVAYEPVYSIKGFADLKKLKAQPPKMEDIEAVHGQVRELFYQAGYKELAARMRILYGGSSNQENAGKLLSEPYIDGLLVGTASWDLETFLPMIQTAAQMNG